MVLAQRRPDFLINYDIKYRLGVESNGEELDE
jgi:hypothetical protein